MRAPIRTSSIGLDPTSYCGTETFGASLAIMSRICAALKRAESHDRPPLFSQSSQAEQMVSTPGNASSKALFTIVTGRTDGIDPWQRELERGTPCLSKEPGGLRASLSKMLFRLGSALAD
jgi:hypothetical protein